MILLERFSNTMYELQHPVCREACAVSDDRETKAREVLYFTRVEMINEIPCVMQSHRRVQQSCDHLQRQKTSLEFWHYYPSLAASKMLMRRLLGVR